MSDMIHKFSAGGVVYRNGEVLVIKWLSHGTIEFPKGVIESGEVASEAAVREVLEETGYQATVVDDLDTVTFEFDWHDGNRYKKTVHYFLMSLQDGAISTPHREEDEDFENLWLTPQEARRFLSHNDSRTVLQRAIHAIAKVE